jgi:hypothetical protein
MSVLGLTSHSSAIWEESWSLIWKWGSLTTIITGAPSSSFAESGTSAFPGLGALLGTLPVIGLGDGAILIVGMSSSVFSEVSFPEFLSVIVVFSIGGNVSVSKTNGWWGTGSDGGDEAGKS